MSMRVNSLGQASNNRPKRDKVAVRSGATHCRNPSLTICAVRFDHVQRLGQDAKSVAIQGFTRSIARSPVEWLSEKQRVSLASTGC
jgi:hypothetical protein